MIKEIKYHSRHENNLASIKAVLDIYSDRIFLSKLFRQLYEDTGELLVDARRPNYDILSIVGEVESLAIKKTINKTDDKNYRVSFSSKKVNANDDLFDLLVEIWFGFEHASFCFFVDELTEPMNIYRPWYDITALRKSFAVFKGAEEDVVWIGKSKELEFSI